MQIKGKILDFDRVYNIAGTRNYYFPKDAVIDIPEKIPIVLEFRMDANNVLGHGVITRDDEGLFITGDISDDRIENLYNSGVTGIGGFYTRIDLPKNSYLEAVPINYAALKAVGVTANPISDEYRYSATINPYTIEKEEEE